MRRVFYSFHYHLDVFRVNLIRNMGVLEDDRPVQPNAWETVRRKSNEAIKRWINNTMDLCSCVVVLIGTETAKRFWVKYEIERAWTTGKGLMGIYIHNLKNIDGDLGKKGGNPFSRFQLKPRHCTLLGDLQSPINLSKVVSIKDPDSSNAFEDIKEHLALWVEEAIKIRKENDSFQIEKTLAELFYGNVM